MNDIASRRKKLSQSTKMKLVNATVMPVLMKLARDIYSYGASQRSSNQRHMPYECAQED